MKYLRIFEKENNYTEYKDSGEWIIPNISLIRSTGRVTNKPYTPPPAMAGDVAYWNGYKVKTIPLSSWDTSLGTPVGVVVVPEGFAPDGKIRIVSLMNIGGGDFPSPYLWGSDIDRSLTNFTKVPTTDNAGSTSSATANGGYLPSDNFSGVTSFVDSKANYSGSTPYIVSPYLGDEPNPEYYKELDGGNALSDFNGLSNTQTLTELGSKAASVAYRYKDGVSNLQWYLPAMGELGYLIPRFNEINNTITALGGVAGFNHRDYWSSSENSKRTAYYLNATNGHVYAVRKDRSYYVRPFSSF